MSVFAPDPPDDLVEFWQAAAEESRRAPLDFHRDLSSTQVNDQGLLVQTLTFRGIKGEPRHGWIAYPEGARREIGFLWTPPYGRESLLPNQYGTRAGMTSLSFNFFGHEAYHQEKYTPSRGYFAEGVDSPSTWIFRTMFQDAYMAARVLQAQFEVDEDRVGAMGMSQGGGISIWLGAWCPIIRAVCTDMPFLGAMRAALSRNVHRYPLKELIDHADRMPLGMERMLATIAYFDTVNQATACHVPTHVSLGLKDPAARPENVEAIFEALPGTKMLRQYDWGHDWLPAMIENNRNWLIEHLP